MLEIVRRAVKKFGLVKPGDHVIIAVSGGPDSMALLQVLFLLSPEYDLTLTVAHLNHGLRAAESDAEEELVRRLSRERGIPCVVKKVNLPVIRAEGKGKRSLEDLGREERYTFFSTLAEKVGAVRIALGHHREDQAETVLMNLIRGSGLEGLKGILPLRDEIFIRPLLEVSRREILEFLRITKIPFLEDSSNSQDQFLRNRIRHQLIPLLQREYNPKIIGALNRTASIARREDECLKSLAGRILDAWQVPDQMKNGIAILEIPEIRALPEALQYRVIKSVLGRFVLSPYRVTSAHIQAVLDLCNGGNKNGILFMPGNILIKRECGTLIFTLKENCFLAIKGVRGDGRDVEDFSYNVKIPALVQIAELGRAVKTDFAEADNLAIFGKERNIAYFDYDKVQPPLVIRNRRDGDRFQPSGMSGTKKLKAYFIDEKIPRQKRDFIPLLADRNSVIWIAGLRLSERVRVSDQSRNIVKIEII